MTSRIVRHSDLQLAPLSLTAQKEEGFRPRVDIQPWPLVIPIDWGSGPFRDRNWRFHLSAWRMLDPYINEYFRVKDCSLCVEALSFVSDWHRFHIVEGKSHPYSWYDMSCGLRALRLAFLIELIKRGELDVDSSHVERLFQLGDAHVYVLRQEDLIALNNHSIIQVVGLYLLCQVMGNKSEEECFAKRKYLEIMELQFTSEGVHAENSPDYHFFVHKMMRRSRAVQLLGDAFVNKEHLILSVFPWLVFPTGEVARIGDSISRSNPLTSDPASPAVLDDGRTFAIGDFTRSGYAVVRSLPSSEQSSMLFVTGMAHTVAHKHADELSFELFEFGRFIFVDSGKYGYKNGEMRRYVLSANAHNTIGLRDRRIGPNDVELTGSLLEPVGQRGNAFVIEGTAHRPGLFAHRRRIAYNPGHSLVVTDTLSADGSREYVSSLHLAPDLEPVLYADGFEVRTKKNWVRAKLRGDGARIEVVRGQKDPLLGWQCVGYLTMTPTTVVRAICPGQDRLIEWEIDLG